MAQRKTTSVSAGSVPECTHRVRYALDGMGGAAAASKGQRRLLALLALVEGSAAGRKMAEAQQTADETATGGQVKLIHWFVIEVDAWELDR